MFRQNMQCFVAAFNVFEIPYLNFTEKIEGWKKKRRV